MMAPPRRPPEEVIARSGVAVATPAGVSKGGGAPFGPGLKVLTSEVEQVVDPLPQGR